MQAMLWAMCKRGGGAGPGGRVGKGRNTKISLGKDLRGPVNNLDPRPFPAAGSAPRC